MANRAVIAGQQGLRSFLMMDFAFLVLAVMFGELLFGSPSMPAASIEADLAAGPLAVMLVLSLALCMGYYRAGRSEDGALLRRWLAATLMAGLAWIVAGEVGLIRQTDALGAFVGAGFGLAGMTVFRLALPRLIRSVDPGGVLIVADGGVDVRVLVRACDRFSVRTMVGGCADVGSPRSAATHVAPAYVVKVGDVDAAAAATIADLRGRGACVMDAEVFVAKVLGQSPLEDPATGAALAALGAAPRGRFGAAAKRLLDAAISAAMIVAFAPLLVALAALVRLEDGGPALYRQVRVGAGGRQFTLLKFRSMRVDAECAGGARWAAQGDPRITRMGRIMRPTRLDELPQLLNVLAGDMSIVGPRPERPEMIEGLAQAIPHYGDRHRVPPGLTGWAQVNFPYGASVEDAVQKTRYDIFYVLKGTLLLDLRIMLETVRVVLLAEGAR